MAQDLQERMTPILQRLAAALVEATPEWWSEATLRVEVRRSGQDTSISHSIWSDQHPRDVVEATEEIFAASRALQLLCEQAGQPWVGLVFRIEQVGEAWRFESVFEYPA